MNRKEYENNLKNYQIELKNIRTKSFRSNALSCGQNISNTSFCHPFDNTINVLNKSLYVTNIPKKSNISCKIIIYFYISILIKKKTRRTTTLQKQKNIHTHNSQYKVNIPTESEAIIRGVTGNLPPQCMEKLKLITLNGITLY